jgi:uncharacterized protein (DUF58 family)
MIFLGMTKMLFRRIFRLDKNNQARPKDQSSNLKMGSGLLPAGLMHQLDRLQIRGSRELRGERIGMRPSHRRKPSAEFFEHRMYVPGDDIRYVDWRASARHENIFIRQGELPKEIIIYLLIDCSGSMNWGENPKLELQKRLASIIGYLALSQGDRLYVRPYGGTGNVDFGPVSGKGQFNSFVRYLAKLNYGGEASLANGIRGLKGRITRGGILFVLSDLLERASLDDILGGMPAPLWWVNVVHMLHPHETKPVLRGALELVDQETGARANYDLTSDALKAYAERIEKWQNSLEMACVQNHAFYTLLDTEASLEKEVIPHLRSLKVLVAQ